MSYSDRMMRVTVNVEDTPLPYGKPQPPAPETPTFASMLGKRVPLVSIATPVVKKA